MSPYDISPTDPFIIVGLIAWFVLTLITRHAGISAVIAAFITTALFGY